MNLLHLCLVVLAASQKISASSPDATCQTRRLQDHDIAVLEDGKLHIPAYNITAHVRPSHVLGHSFLLCFNRSDAFARDVFAHCDKLVYDSDEFVAHDNGTVVVFGDTPFHPGAYEIDGDTLMVCDHFESDYDFNGTLPVSKIAFINIGRIGSGVSIAALIAHLVVFGLVPGLRNQPGYSLMSLSVAFLFAYALVIFGQIPEILGLACIVSGALQHYFFLAAFFCMNALAFDVWRTLRKATTKLMISTQRSKRRQLAYYSAYSWGVPCIITIAAVVVDNSEHVPDAVKPKYGSHNVCTINNNLAKAIFFSIPALVVFSANGVFFVLSGVIIKKNAMTNTNDLQKQNARVSFVLYLRLGLMMGVTWLLGFVAQGFHQLGYRFMWYVFDVLNSLQGLFLFVLSCFTKKVYQNLQTRFSMMRTRVSMDVSKNTTFTNRTESDPV